MENTDIAQIDFTKTNISKKYIINIRLSAQGQEQFRNFARYKRKYSAKNYREISRDLLANGYKANEIDLTRILTMLTDDFRGNKLGWFHTGIGWFEYEGKTAFSYNGVVTCDQELQSQYRKYSLHK